MGVITFSINPNNDAFGFGSTGSSAAIYVVGNFTADQNIGSIDVTLSTFKNGSPADNVVYTIQGDNAGVPDNVNVGTPLVVAGSSLPTSAGAAAFLGTITGLSLVNGTKYYLCGHRSGSQDASNNYSWPFQTSGSFDLFTQASSDAPIWQTHSAWATRGSITTHAAAAGPANVKTWDGVTQSTGIKTYFAVTLASVKTVDGIN